MFYTTLSVFDAIPFFIHSGHYYEPSSPQQPPVSWMYKTNGLGHGVTTSAEVGSSPCSCGVQRSTSPAF
jgi:hypothetical protein